MAKHDVTFSVSERSIGNADMVFKIRKDSVVFGTLKISKGGVEWCPKNKQYGNHLTWSDFDMIMKADPKLASA
jgi:hypothetical protein